MVLDWTGTLNEFRLGIALRDLRTDAGARRFAAGVGRQETRVAATIAAVWPESHMQPRLIQRSRTCQGPLIETCSGHSDTHLVRPGPEICCAIER